MHYWDTSALVKLYISEPDSGAFSAHLAITGPVVTCELARWEMFRVLARKEAEGLITLGSSEVIFNRFLLDVARHSVVLIPLSSAVEDQFRQLVARLHRLSPPIFTRTLDGMHLASADL